jgi:hypothetical protein
MNCAVYLTLTLSRRSSWVVHKQRHKFQSYLIRIFDIPTCPPYPIILGIFLFIRLDLQNR